VIRSVLLVWPLLLLLVSTPVCCVYGLPAQDDVETVFDLGWARVIPGARARVALMLFLGDRGSHIKEAVHRTCFSDQFIRFVEVETGFAAQGATAQIAQEIEERDGDTCLILGITFKNDPVSGTLATLVFETDGTAPLDHRVTLKAESRVMAAGGPVAATARDGEIIIVEVDPIFGCFFYMH